MQSKKCKQCGMPLQKDWIALNKKLLNQKTDDFFCLSCLADMLDCDVEDLEVKIEEFKDAGCTLFE